MLPLWDSGAGGTMVRHSRIGLDVSVWFILLLFFVFLLITLCETDWLREKVYFDGLVTDKKYTTTRLGFNAPNIFVVTLLA